MQYPIEPFVISGEGVLTPPDRARWVTEEMFLAAGQKPVFTAMEVAHLCFGKSTVWLRQRLVERRGTYDPPRTDSGHRRFGLHDVEDLAHILLADRAISALQFAMTIRVIKSVAILNLYEIGDGGFLVKHWNGASQVRRQVITLVLDQMEHADDGRTLPSYGADIKKATTALQRAERDITFLNDKEPT